MEYLKVRYKGKETQNKPYPPLLTQYLLKKYVSKKGGKFLDIGCGFGDYLQAFQNIGYEVKGYDLSPETMKLPFDISIGNLEKDKLPYQENEFDVIFSKSVIEHLFVPENYLIEIKRVLKPGGRFFCLCPDWNSQKDNFYNDPTHVHPYNLSSLNQLFQMYNFKIIEVTGFYQLPFVWKYPVLGFTRHFFRFFPYQPTKNVSFWGKLAQFSKERMCLGVVTK